MSRQPHDPATFTADCHHLAEAHQVLCAQALRLLRFPRDEPLPPDAQAVAIARLRHFADRLDHLRQQLGGDDPVALLSAAYHQVAAD